MVKYKSYKLLCPIARGLDRIGDRWTLLILRDLHAGPARFSDLQRGLSGIAANLLTDRLAKLVSDKLIEKTDGQHGAALYRLTELGEKTQSILFDLAMFGAMFPPIDEVQRPGNLRTIAVSLGTACKRAVTSDMKFEASLIVDGEHFTLVVGDGTAKMEYRKALNPDVIMTTGYDAMMSLAEGQIIMENFFEQHCDVQAFTESKPAEFSKLMVLAFGVMKKGLS